MWPTPTPIPQSTPEYSLGVDPAQFGQDIVTGVVQGFNFLDSQPFASVIWFALLALLIIIGLMSIRNRLQQNG